MFKIFKKNKSCDIYSPIIRGYSIGLENVPDKVFATKMMGEGIGLINDDNRIIAPFDGEIIMVFPSKHAVGIRSNEGVEVLIHIGLDTVNFAGEGFISYVSEGDKIKQGDILISFDVDFMTKHKVDLTTPMVITNSNKFNIEVFANNGEITNSSIVLRCIEK